MPEETGTAVRDETRPDGSWKFDAAVAAAFDDMLARSIPQYDVMREAVAEIGLPFARPETDIVDLGCSRGEALASFAVRLKGQGCRFVGVEVSEPMLDAARERFALLSDAGVVRIENLDLRHGYPDVSASLTLSVLTLQFVPMEYRARVVEEAFLRTVPGGAFILVEKVLGASPRLDEEMVRLYYDLKRRNGYTDEAIQRKRLALEGVLVPVPAAFNEQMLRDAGFREIDCFWRWFNFAGWIAVKR